MVSGQHQASAASPLGKLSLILTINYYDMNSYGGVDEYIQVFLTPVIFGDWSASGLGRFKPGEKCSYA
jgi:hypothetical protein